MSPTKVAEVIPSNWLSDMEKKYPHKGETIASIPALVGWEDSLQQQLNKGDAISSIMRTLRVKSIVDKNIDVLSPTGSTKKKKRKKKKKSSKPPPPMTQGVIERVCATAKEVQPLTELSLQHLLQLSFMTVCGDTEAAEVNQLLKESSAAIITNFFTTAAEAYSNPFTPCEDYLAQLNRVRNRFATCHAYPTNPGTSLIKSTILSIIEKCDLALAMLFCRRLHSPLNLLRQTALMDVSKAQWNSYSAFFSDRCATHGVTMTFRLVRKFISQQYRGSNSSGFSNLLIKELICRVTAMLAARYLDLSPSCARARQVRFDSYYICREARSLRDFYKEANVSTSVTTPIVDLLLFGCMLDCPLPKLVSFFKAFDEGNRQDSGSIPNELWMPPLFQPGVKPTDPGISHEELTGIEVPLRMLIQKSSFTKAQLGDIISRRWELWDVVPRLSEEEKFQTGNLRAIEEILKDDLSFSNWDAIRTKHEPPEQEQQEGQSEQEEEEQPQPREQEDQQQQPQPQSQQPNKPRESEEEEESEIDEEDEEDEEGETNEE